ncbi:hypothetical protein NXS19_010627 [Fusarium pseudograminearum]|nr:hypothetical protein NXS19_010627 [Fusarium pseudograminearum]
MGKHTNNKNKKPRAVSAPYSNRGNQRQVSGAPSGQLQQQQQQEAAPAANPPRPLKGTLAEAEANVAHWNSKVLHLMDKKTALEQEIEKGMSRVAEWTAAVQQRSVAPSGQSIIDAEIKKRLAKAKEDEKDKE